MLKKQVNITVDPRSTRGQKQLGLNVSKMAENILRSVLQPVNQHNRYISRSLERVDKSPEKITAQKLCKCFASTYIDAFCGRTPRSTLERHYLNYSPRKLEEVYKDAGITVLE